MLYYHVVFGEQGLLEEACVVPLVALDHVHYGSFILVGAYGLRYFVYLQSDLLP